MSYIRIFEHSIRFSKRNRVSYFRIFLHIDARELSPPQTFCLIIESPPYWGAREPRENRKRESIENGKMIGIEKYEIKNENIYYYIKKG